MHEPERKPFRDLTVIVDYERGVALMCDPQAPSGCKKCRSYWDVTFGFMETTGLIQEHPFRLRLGRN